MFTKRQTGFIYAAAAMTALFAAGVTWLEIPGRKEMERYSVLPDFALTDQNGRPVALADLKGKVWLADFVYTTCPGPCPLITAHMARIQRKLPPDADLRLVSFSTDPAHDTPEVLKAYSSKFEAGDRWEFLTGPQVKMQDLIRHGFLLAMEVPRGAPVIHSTKMMLVDKTGTVRGIYDGTSSESDDQILADMKTLLEE